MAGPMRFLIAESEAPDEREQRRDSVGRSSGETYADILRELVPDCACIQVKPAEQAAATDGLELFDAVFLCGAPMHVYERSPETGRMIDFMRAVFASGTPSFGSCAGLQVAVVAAGGTVRPNARGHEAAFARRIVATAAGTGHGLLAGRPATWDAPSIHSDEVDTLPEGAVLLATNGVTRVQAAELRQGPGVFWGVQYHPELTLHEVAGAVRRQAASLVESGLVADEAAAGTQADRIAALHEAPERRDLAWALGLDTQVTDPALRQTELRNAIEHLVWPARAERGRG